MSKITIKFATVGVAIATVASLSGSAFAQTTSAQAQIAALMAQIAALQAQLGTPASSSSYNFAKNLTLGSKGADVTALQNVLISGGFLKISAPTAYFGPLTKTAVIAWQAANGISPTSGYVGPLSRAKLNAAVVTTGGTQTGGGVTVPVSGGAISVGLASDNPLAASVAVGTNELVPVLNLNFSAGSSNATVTGFNVVRSGLSSDQDLNNVYLMDGSKVIATNMSVSNGVVNFSNPMGLFTVNANSSKKITVAVSLVSTAAGHTLAFSVASASAITSNASSVQGSFPISGNVLTAATVTNLGSLAVANNSSGNTNTTGLTVNAGQTNYIVGQFTLQAQNQTVSVRSIKATLVGSTNATDLTNIKLFSGATQLGATATGVDANNVVTFDLSASPLQLTAGQTVQLYVYADVNGTVGRYFQFSVQHNYDVIAQDMMYNVGILPANPTGQSTSYPMNLSYVNVQSGTLTMTRNANSPVNYVLPGGTNQVLAQVDFKAVGEAVRVTALNLDLTGTSIGTSSITNLKVVDDQGTQIGTTQQAVSTYSAPAAYTNLNYVIPANTTRTLSIYADLNSSASGNMVAGITGVVGQGYTSLASLTGSNVYGNTLSANATLLSVYQNSALGSTNVVAGQNAAKVGSFTLVAGAASDVSVSAVSLVATSSANIQNLLVKVGGTQVGQTQPTIVNGTTYNFSFSSPVTIPKGGQIVVDVYADVKTTASSVSGVIVYVPATTGVSATAVATSQVVSSVPAAQVNGQTVAITTSGAATYALYNTPAAGQIGMGSTGVVLATYKVTGSANEALTLNTVYLKATSTNTSVFTNFRLVDAAGKQWGTTLNLAGAGTSSTLTWVGVNIPVAQNGYVSLSVVADANTWTVLQGTGVETASQNATTSASINQIDFIGAASNTTGNTTSTSYGSIFNVLRTTMTPATATGVTMGTGAASRTLVGAFTISAGAGNDVVLTNMSLTQLISNASSSATTSTVTIYDSALNQDVASAAVTVTGITPVVFGMASSTVTAGTSKTYYVYSDTSSFRTKPANSSASITDQIGLTAMTWSDGTVLGLSSDPRVVLPLAGAASPTVIVP